MKLAAMCDFPHFLEHLAPLCHFLDMPLVHDDPDVEEACQRYHPTVKPEAFSMDGGYELIFTSSKYSAEKLKIFFPKARYIFVPHGNSDKPMDIFDPQETALIYGPQMASRLSGIETITVGNYRRAYYDTLGEAEIGTILYAPTWRDDQESTTFLETYPQLLDVPKNFHLVIKLHPFLEKSYPTEVLHFREMAAVNPRMTWLDNAEPIYPLLSKCQYYLGDHSSMGYDFLAFNRPLFFCSKFDGPLQEVGTKVEGNPYDCIKKTTDTLSEKRQAFYKKVFAEMPKNLAEVILDGATRGTA